MLDICSYCLTVFGPKASDLKMQLSRYLPSGTSSSGEKTDPSEDAEVEEGPGNQPALKKAKLHPTNEESPPSVLWTCVLCLGLNSEAYIEALVEKIMERLDAESYSGISSFVLAVHAPLSLKVRRMGMERFLKSTPSGISELPTEAANSAEIIADSTNQQETAREECHSPKPSQGVGQVTFISDEYYVKTNVRLRTKYLIEKKRPQLTYNVDSPFLITVKLSHVTSDRDCIPVIDLASKSLPNSKSKRSRNRAAPVVTTNAVNDSIDALSPGEYADNAFFLTPVQEPCTYEIEFMHKPVFVGGRYNKYSRTLSQTPWIVDGERKTDSSVEELICDKLTELIRADGHNFSSSGREDVDVRMLGDGRPFLVEFLNPKNHLLTSEELESTQREINASTTRIQVQRLKIVSKEATIALKKGEEEKVKCYSSIIWTPQEISSDSLKFLNEITNLDLDQKTPIRVLHRRTLAVRKRTIYDLKAEYMDSHHFTLLLSTQAGTYVKEFVHGDFGRTQPNLRVLLKQDVDILSLDVLEVKLDWPV